MAFKKEQVLKSAEKLVARGRIDAAIKEYMKVLAKVGDDSNIHNRIGDLYARLRNSDGAIKHYSQTADSYAKDGFYVKAIAVYKKIDRLEPGRIEVHSKLAELYDRQGLINDARSHYQHLADHYHRQSDAAAAIGVYQKMVNLEPDNPSHHAKLAELYRQEKLPGKALREYGFIASHMLSHEQVDQALQVYIRALDIDATDLAFLKEAVTALSSVGGPTAAEQLLSVAVQRNPEVEQLRGELCSAPEAETPEAVAGTGSQPIAAVDPVLAAPATETLVPEVAAAPPPAVEVPAAAESPPAPSPSGDEFEEFVLDFDDDEKPASLVTPPPDMMEEPVAPPAPVDVEEEIELELEDAAASVVEPSTVDTGPVTETPMSLRESGASESVDWDFEPEPELESPPLTPEDVELELADSQTQPSVPAPEASASQTQPSLPSPEPPPPVVAASQTVPDVRASQGQPSVSEPPIGSITGTHGQAVIRREDDLLAEAEVFVKYGLHEKAVDRLEEVLSINPRHLAAHSQLIALFLEQGAHDRVASLGAGMAEIAQEKGAADSWLEIRQHLEGAGFRFEGDRIVALPGGAAEVPSELPSAEVPAEVAAAAEAATVDEVDIEAVAVGETPPDLLHSGEMAGLVEADSEPALDLSITEDVRAPGRAAAQPPPSPPRVAPSGVEEPMRPSPQERMPEAFELPIREAPEPTPLARETPPPTEPSVPSTDDMAQSTTWLDDEPEAVDTAAGETLFEGEEDFFDLAAELQEDLAGDEVAVQEVGEPVEQSLEEIVEGFKKGVSENLSEEDSDTHYNLGIAYREMSLLDEAISEFQIAARSPDYLVDSCAMLGLCFQEKGLPELALKWYKKALDAPGVAEQQALGMLYDVGGCYLAINDRESAYKTFVEIYGVNSGYRDVAAKLQELQPTQT